MSDGPLPLPLAPVEGRLPLELCRGAVDGLGGLGQASQVLLDRGLVPPDVLVGMTLLLLVQQPRRPRADGARPKGAVAGGVWVREQVTLHRPVRIDAPLFVTGESARRFVRGGRRYGVTTSETRDEAGRLLVSSCTTGLLQYRRDPTLADGSTGREDVRIAGPDVERAADNPARDRLAALRPGDRIAGERALVTLDMMRARDASRDDNPIHTDPEVARREGLAAPIAGGSHVLSFLVEALLRAWGPEALLHGAHFDVRWLAQTYAGTRVTPRATVEEATSRSVTLALEVEGEDRVAMTGTLQLPLSAAG